MNLISRLKKPLVYASSLPPEKIERVRGLGESLRAILDSSSGGEEFASFRKALAVLDQLPPPKKKEQISLLLKLLEELEKKRKAETQAQTSLHAPKSPALSALETEVMFVKGVGPRVAQKLSRLNISTVGDLLFHLPARYEDRRNLVSIRELVPGRKATLIAEILAAGPGTLRRGRRIFEMMAGDGTGILTLKWWSWRGDYLEKKFKKGDQVLISGEVRAYRGSLEMHHPELAKVEGEEDLGGIVPFYPLTEGITQRQMRRMVRNALDSFGESLPDPLPAGILKKRALPPLSRAFRIVHAPSDDEDFESLSEHRSPGHRRLAYEEFFFLQLGLALRRKGAVEKPAAPVHGDGRLVRRFRESLPFKLTRSQEEVLSEILSEMRKPHPMLRLLQGDVGSGKTVVAVMAALAAVEAGMQAAIMAPTEVLALQHFRNLEKMLAPVGLRPFLLTSAVRGREREKVLNALESGSARVVIGTHALIQGRVRFKRLALAVVDEQHRFGVLQRANLKAKGEGKLTPHLLVMTATPIPRTLAMTLYGDLSVSILRELPPGRRPVKTEVYSERDRKHVYEEVRKELAAGRQAFIVSPLVDDSDRSDLASATARFQELRELVFPEFSVGLLHGRMKERKKDEVMRAFQEGRIQVLVATTVVEVGVDVPNATMMVVENAERFGLSQLHQLRGRVGRGEHPSRCILLAGFTRSEEAWQRLKVMEKTSDGFKIAEEDLRFRGPGEFFGTRQFGMPDFRAANLVRDQDLLKQAREDAFQLVQEDPLLSRPEHRDLKILLKKRWGKRLRLGAVA